MPKFKITAKTDQIVTRQVQLNVEASSEAEAEERARLALNEFPSPLSYMPFIKSILVTNQKYWIPKSIDFVKNEQGEPNVAQ